MGNSLLNITESQSQNMLSEDPSEKVTCIVSMPIASLRTVHSNRYLVADPWGFA